MPGLRTCAALSVLIGALAFPAGAPAAKPLRDTAAIEIVPWQTDPLMNRLLLYGERYRACVHFRRVDLFRRDPSGPVSIYSISIPDLLGGPTWDFDRARFGLKTGDVLFATADRKTTKIRVKRGKKRKLVCEPIVSADVTLPPAPSAP
jgi:hypothetical protein